MDLYYFPASSACRSVLMTARELGVALNLKFINGFGGKETRTAEYRKLNPQHTVPLLDDNGFILAESRTIMRYLVNKYQPGSSLYPTDPKERAKVDRFLDFDCGTLGAIGLDNIKTKYYFGKEPTPEQMLALKESLQIMEDLIDGDLPFLCGSRVTLADLSIVTIINSLYLLQIHISDYPKISTWVARMETLPYYEELNTIPMKKAADNLLGNK